MLRILVVEDCQSKQEIFKECITQHSITIVDNSVDAIKELTNKYDVIFLDYNLKNGAMGGDVAYFIVDSVCNEAKVYVHSNDDGGWVDIHSSLPNAVKVSSDELAKLLLRINDVENNLEDANDIKNEQDKSRGEED
jgi:hypothetical protein